MSTFKSGAFKVLYAYTIDGGNHNGRLKVGDATFHTTQTLEEIRDESKKLNPDNRSHQFSTPGIIAAAKRRIDQQTSAADIKYTFLWAILAVKPTNPTDEENSPTITYVPFRDYEVHSVLKRNMVGNIHHRPDKKIGEWFKTDLNTVQNAVTFLQTGYKSEDSKADVSKVKLRKEQEEAIKFTKKHFKDGSIKNPKQILWSAIMRFGKTLTTYETVKRSSDINKVLIVTHRPVVSDGWHTDFDKIFATNPNVHFSSRDRGETWDQVKNHSNFFYFASIQDLRGSIDEASGKFKKNAGIFATDWDLIVTDEAHEGTSTILAETMYGSLRAKYWLHLSGTPFNIVENFPQTHVYKWDYIDEQKARKQWGEENPLDSNPYDNLPTIEIFTYDISENFKDFKDNTTVGFNFRKFFKVEKEISYLPSGKPYRKFIKEEPIWDLLNMMTKSEDYEIDKREFPFSTAENLDTFKHTFWLLPSVESAVALEEMLGRHGVFQNYKVVNVTAANFAGDNALRAVQDAIRENKRTITLSYNRLTTGVTVPEWSGVMLLSNLKSSMSYMQTIFRVKSGGILPGGKIKDKGYVFDFAPDRTLTMVAHASQLTRDSVEDRSESVNELLQYMPIISGSGSRFVNFNTDRLMNTINRIFITKTVNAGFETSLLYKLDSHKIDAEMLEKFLKLQKTVGNHTSTDSKSVVINVSQLTNDGKDLLKKKRDKLDTQTEKIEWSKADADKKADAANRKAIIKVLNSVSVRIPLMVFAAPPKEKVTIDTLTDLIDDESWDEFMPKGFTKEIGSSSWKGIKEFYDATIFEGACKEVQDRVRRMDDLRVLDRVAAIANLFSTFKNPDKETVLTPWSVVCRQYSDTLGGLRMVDNSGRWFAKDTEGNIGAYTWEDIQDNEFALAPQWTPVDEELENFWSKVWTNDYTTILDINSKTALYPLYAAVSLWFRMKSEFADLGEVSRKDEDDIWMEIIKHHIFLNCRVEYSRSIAERVLTGYKDQKVNASVIDVLKVREVLKEASLKDTEIGEIWQWIFNPESIGTYTQDGAMTVAEERANVVLNMPAPVKRVRKPKQV